MESDRHERIRRLARAVQVHLEFASRGGGEDERERLLAEHADLRDLLEPMLQQEEDMGGEAAAAGMPEAGPERRVLGEFEIVRELGRGGMGVVYEAVQATLGRRVALKVMPAQELAGERALWRFQREARLAARLEHPNLVRVFDVGTADGMHWYAMELVRGAPLSAILDEAREEGLSAATEDTVLRAVDAALYRLDADEPPPSATRTEPELRRRGYVRSVVGIAVQVAEALQYAHDQGVVHRDVKPANILVRKDGTAMLTDFGIARQEGLPAMTATGDFAGTPYYVSPEQALGKPGAVDHRSDVYSLGVTLYELVTLRRPFEGETTHEILARILRQEPPDPCRYNPRLAPDLAAILLKALEKDPGRRYQSAADLAADLRAFLDYRPVTARRPGAWARLRKWVRREPWKAALAGTVLAAALGLLVVSAYFTRELIREGALAQKALADFNLLANAVRLQEARAEATTFRPAWPDRVPAMEAWLQQRGQPLAALLPDLRAKLQQLRDRAEPYGETEAAQDRDRHPRAAELAEIDAELERVRAAVAGDDPEREAQRQSYLARLEKAAADLRPEVDRRRTYRFARPEDQFLHDRMAQLVEDLEHFASDPDGALAIVRENLAWAKEVERRSLREAEGAWQEAAAAIARSEHYGGLQLAPQVGLLPLGEDPHSGLWEFVHLRSGEPGREVPRRRADGRLEITGDTGIVFVLVPAGSFWMGAQNEDPEGRNYDPEAEADEAPVHEVTLDAYFLSKYELTQGQWRRLSRGGVPSLYNPTRPKGRFLHPVTWANPVENVSWHDCRDLLVGHGLQLPTEAQWEYACRAGTGTPWSFGSDRLQFARYGNLCGETAFREVGWIPEKGVDDGHLIHAAAGCFEPNGYGFFDMHGNVYEWCRDGYGPYTRPVRAGDGLLPHRPFDLEFRMMRGGSYKWHAETARSSERFGNKPLYRNDDLGVRPARRLLPARRGHSSEAARPR